MEQNRINQKLMNLGSDHYPKIKIKFPDGHNLGSSMIDRRFDFDFSIIGFKSMGFKGGSLNDKRVTIMSHDSCDRIM